MKNHIKYLAVGEEDKKWDIFINAIGSSKIEEGEEYPPRKHPSSYYFTWNNGRILSEFQIIYITQGNGTFENKYASYDVSEGSFIIIFPGEWHRYKPKSKNGWTENYIGFEGKIAEHFMSQIGISRKNPIVNSGIKEQFIDCYMKIFDLVESESPGFQLISSGLLIKLMGLIVANKKEEELEGESISEIIDKIRFIIRDNVESEIVMQEVAANFNIGYSYFRKMFKKYTGVSPKQYHLQLKIMRAKELLISTDKSVKEVCFDLGFQSTSYFSRIFKQKMGVSPIQIKEKMESYPDVL
ncbi:MAG: AraC family transcriptional regulator [Bacteroidota bacterium]